MCVIDLESRHYINTECFTVRIECIVASSFSFYHCITTTSLNQLVIGQFLKFVFLDAGQYFLELLKH